MKLSDVVVLLPCYSLEDLPLDQAPEQAESILAAWSAAFHPAVLVSSRKTARWASAETPPDGDDLKDALVLLPAASEASVPKGWADMAESAGALILRASSDRADLLGQILAHIDAEPGFSLPDEADGPLTDDLLALGLGFLQVELLTRQMRYMSSLDEGQFGTEALRAAEAILRHEPDAARQHLQRAFEILAEGREYFYPVEAHVLNLVLVASTTLGRPLARELDAGGPSNLLLSGELLERLAVEQPDVLARLVDLVKQGRISVAGGPFRERPLGLLSPESILAEFRRGLAVYQRRLGDPPAAFASRRMGLCPMLPGVLVGLGIGRALHLALDGAQFPTSSQSKVRWEGPDGATVETLARPPLDAAVGANYLKLPDTLGQVMDLDHAATVVFAHWPAGGSVWHEDLRRMSAYAPVLGRLVRLEEYFSQTEGSGQTVCHDADAYCSRSLVEDAAAGRADPLSRWVRYHGRRATIDALYGLVAMRQMIAGWIDAQAVDAMDRLAEEVEDRSAAEVESTPNDLDTRLAGAVDAAVRAAAQAIPRQDLPPRPGVLMFNPWSFSRRTTRVPNGDSAEGTAAMPRECDVPAMGFAWVETPLAGDAESGSSASAGAKTKKRRFWRRANRPAPPMTEPCVLRNEFFEVTLDPVTGAIRSVSDYESRGNRLAMQVALRAPQPRRRPHKSRVEEDVERDYSIMAADTIEVVSTGPVLGQIDVRGRLVDRQGQQVARFVQSLRARRGNRVLEIEIDLEPERLPDPGPWQSYYAARLAWADGSAEFVRSVNASGWPTEATRIEAPHFIEIRGQGRRTTLLAAGLPFHRRIGTRKLDTLLVVHGETARRFRLGVGIDVPHPASAALEFMTPTTTLVEPACPPVSPAGWLFHLDAPHVVVTHWEPVAEGHRVMGFRARLLETEGLRTPVGLRSFRPVVEARRIDLRGEPLGPLVVDGDRIDLEIRPHQWLAVEGRWEKSP